MAPMDKAKEPFNPPPREGPSREELEKALAGNTVDDLKEMAKRLAKSHESLNVMLEDLQAERKGLEEENAEVKQTIDRFMKELQKLNIGADNTVEPQLAEDPLIFVNRMWEKVRPRDTGVVVSEHVGEIKKPEDGDNSPQAGEKVKQVVENVASAIGPLWQRGLGAWSNLQQKLAEGREPAPKPKPRKRKEAQRPPEAAAEAPAPQVPQTAQPVEKKQEEVPPTAAASSTATAAATEAPPPAPSASSESDKAADEEATRTATEEQISSTILIEAELTLDDGSVQTLQVRAADRCKEVAKSFIQEHSLKAWFTDPLTKWLKKVESDAVKFPVKVQGDLMEIRKQFGKSSGNS